MFATETALKDTLLPPGFVQAAANCRPAGRSPNYGAVRQGRYASRFIGQHASANWRYDCE